MNKLPLILLSLLLATIAVACSDDDDSNPLLERLRADMVTFDSLSGQYACFTLVGRNDAPSTALQVDATGSETYAKLEPNQRLYMRYNILDSANRRCNIAVVSLRATYQDSLRVPTTSTPASQYPQHAIKVRSVWRTGHYINLHCQLEYTGLSRSLYLLMAPDTRYADTVQCWLVHNVYTDTTYFWRETYGSFNVGVILNQPSTKVVRVHINDAVTSSERCYDFVNKQ